jgi:processive 1,2-diacylglycerol beta-glucosyltransferase
MGEGHNTAARNIAEALQAENPTAEVLVADPYTRTNPIVNKLMQKGYTTAINRYPRAWKLVFQLLSRRGVVEGMGPMLKELTGAVDALIREFRPDIIASTYPVFSFLMAKIRRKHSEVTLPFYTVITDSTQINSAWYRCPCDGSIVADEQTANVLRGDGVPENRIHVLGFPVSLAFDALSPCPPPDGIWRVLFFPGGTTDTAIRTIEHLAELPDVHLTVVTGKRQQVHRRLQEAGLPRHGELIGWTQDMPRLMATHHLFIGKAGGATVQEAISAQIPFLVSHIVPGQEEGNISFIEQNGIGALVASAPPRVRDLVAGAMAHDGTLWRAWRANLARVRRPGASRAIARFLLERHHERAAR